MLIRHEARAPMHLRPLDCIANISHHADGSCVFKQGNTHVLCTAVIEKGLSGIVAEYGMLPTATLPRTPREKIAHDLTTQDIQYTLTRVLSLALDQDALEGQFGLRIDCDVLQDHGSAKAACISGSFVAMALALKKWHHLFSRFPLTCLMAGVSCGIIKNETVIDLDNQEVIDADMHLTAAIFEDGKVASATITPQLNPLPAQHIHQLLQVAINASKPVIELQKTILQL